MSEDKFRFIAPLDLFSIQSLSNLVCVSPFSLLPFFLDWFLDIKLPLRTFLMEVKIRIGAMEGHRGAGLCNILVCPLTHAEKSEIHLQL